eukprot:4793573-Prorocentrum_lima.AAC.1
MCIQVVFISVVFCGSLASVCHELSNMWLLGSGVSGSGCGVALSLSSPVVGGCAVADCIGCACIDACVSEELAAWGW